MTPLKESPDEKSAKAYVDVLLPLPFDAPFSYIYDRQSFSLVRGDVVLVPFRAKQIVGVVWNLSNDPPFLPPSTSLKSVSGKILAHPLSAESLDFLKWTASYTLTPRGLVLKMMLGPPDTFKIFKRSRQVRLPESPDVHFLTPFFEPEQQQAVITLQEKVQKKDFSVTLLDGVTGSGKTDVFLQTLQACFEAQKQALILLPQISLAPQVAHRFKQRYGVEATLWHSDLTPSQRRTAWHHVQSDQAKIIIGARSALFLPYANLGIIVVDEEHDHGYKQEEGVIYQGRDLAVARARGAQIPCLLASATPSLETFYNCDQGRYSQVKLTTRYGKAQLPTIHIVDMRGKKAVITTDKKQQRRRDEKDQELNSRKEGKQWISQILADKIESTAEMGEQTLLYLNRRGYAPLTLCGACGQKVECIHCAAWLVYHKQYERFLCHHCGHQCALTSLCQHCGALDQFVPCGPGVERIAEEMTSRFPHLKTEIFSSDMIEDATALAALIRRIVNHDIDILIGTQMIAKGHHFPNLTLVGVIDADIGLTGGDLRASEKTYQLLHQVSGRAGRASKPGYVYLQTYNPQHPVLESILSGQRDDFIAQENDVRRQGDMPPFSRLAALIFQGENGEETEKVARYMVRHAPAHPQITIFGPAPAPLALIRGKYRWRILVKVPKKMSIQSFLQQWLNSLKIPATVKIKIDIDPYSFL